jgi:iron complex outermembrane receptor protein
MLERIPKWKEAGIYFKQALLAIPGILITCSLFAQQGKKFRLNGVVCDSAFLRPLPGVTIRGAGDGENKSTITDSAGRFIFNQAKPGTWKLIISGIAYKELQISVPVTDADVMLDTIFLAGKVTTLREITISSKKPLIERRIDKLVLNVESSPLAAGGSVMDVLQTAPGVSVNDNIISVKGRKGVTIMIDGRPGILSSSDMANILQSLPASSISKIEVIANPSSQYDAAGNGGIINIITKRSKAQGFNGTLNASSGFGVYPKYNGGGSLNYKENRISLFGNYFINRSKRFSEYTSTRAIDSIFFNESGRSKTERTAHNYQAGIDWQTSARSTIGFSMTGNIADNRDKEDFNTDFIKIKKDSSLLAANLTNADYNTSSWNLNHDLQLDTSGKTLKTNIDYSRFIWHNDGRYNNTYNNQDGSPMRDMETLRNNSEVLIKIGSIKIDYTQPVKTKMMTVSAGIKASWVRTDSDIQFHRKISSGWELDEGRTNHFVFDEYITAGYVSVNKKVKDYEFQVGLRAEHTHNKGNLLTGNITNRNDYLKLFPTVFVSKELNGSQTINFSYGKRINRPSYEDLNPFIYYNSPYSFYQGNSFLRPELSNNFDLEYSLNDEWLISLSYSNTKDYFTYLTYLDDITRVSKETINNFRRYVSYGTSISLDKDLVDWWHLSASIDAYYEAFNSFYRTRDFKNSIISVNGDLTASFTPGKNNTIVLMGIYRSPTFDGIKKTYARYRVDAGYEKGWLNKNLVLKLAVKDIFYTYRNNGINRIENLNSEFFNRGDTRVFSIDLTYKFGNQKLKARKRDRGNNDELKRIKGLD